MNQSKYKDQTIALAGIFQVVALIKDLAWHGETNVEAFNTSIASVLKLNSKSVLDIYGDLSQLTIGLRSLIYFLENPANKDLEIARSVFSLLYLEQKLSSRQDLMQIIKQGIIRANHQVNLFTINHSNVIANLAGIYLDTLSTLNFRIQISGAELYLTTKTVSNKIRALLLAGIRSAVLWRQLGGSKLKLFFIKNLLLNTAKQLELNATKKELIQELPL